VSPSGLEYNEISPANSAQKTVDLISIDSRNLYAYFTGENNAVNPVWKVKIAGKENTKFLKLIYFKRLQQLYKLSKLHKWRSLLVLNNLI
jgi:hypothetical protein